MSPGTIVQITDGWHCMVLGTIVRVCPPVQTWHKPETYFIIEIEGKRFTMPRWSFTTDIGPTRDTP